MSGQPRKLAIAVVLASLACLGCTRADPTEALPLLDRINRAHARWKAADIRSYRFTSTVSCFCISGYSAPKRVTVQSGTVTSVIDIRTGLADPVDWRQPVDSLFATLLREATELPSRLEVTFDPVLGYPTSMSFGRPEIDAGGSIMVRSLSPIP